MINCGLTAEYFELNGSEWVVTPPINFQTSCKLEYERDRGGEHDFAQATIVILTYLKGGEEVVGKQIFLPESAFIWHHRVKKFNHHNHFCILTLCFVQIMTVSSCTVTGQQHLHTHSYFTLELEMNFSLSCKNITNNVIPLHYSRKNIARSKYLWIFQLFI